MAQEQAGLLLGFQSKALAELEDIYTETAEAQELASGIGDAAEARQWLRTKLKAVGEKAGFPDVLGEALGGGGRRRMGGTFPVACSGSHCEQSRLAGGSAPHRHSGTSSLSMSSTLVPGACLRGRGWVHHVGLWEEEKRVLIKGKGLSFDMKTTWKLCASLRPISPWPASVAWPHLARGAWEASSPHRVTAEGGTRYPRI